jgi:DNA-binding NarL/FixJ family response regulator
MTSLDCTEFYFGYFGYDAHDQTLKLRSSVWRDTEGSSLESCTVDPNLHFALGEEKGLVGQVAQSAEALYVPDTQNEKRWLDGCGIRSAFLVPVRSEGPCDVVVLLSHEIDGFDEGEQALAVALVGYLAKVGTDESRADLRVRQFERGLRRIALELSDLGVDAGGPSASYPSGLVDRLRLVSPREWEVLERLRTGLRVATIARELTISPNTVRNHLKSIYRKLGVRSQTELLEQLRGSAQVSQASPPELRSLGAA